MKLKKLKKQIDKKLCEAHVTLDSDWDAHCRAAEEWENLQNEYKKIKGKWHRIKCTQNCGEKVGYNYRTIILPES